MMTATDKDQEEFDAHSPEWHDHLVKSFLHATGRGPHPGILTELRQELDAPPDEAELSKGKPSPPQEALEQPPMDKGGGKDGSKPPSKGTPTAIGQEAAATPPPSGDF